MDVKAPLLFPAATLRAFISDVLTAHGMPVTDADMVGSLMVEADLHGSDGHGVFRLPRYIDRLKAGGFNLHPDIRVDRRSGGIARVHGDDAMGHLVVKCCVDEAIALASQHGVACVGCHHGNHAGAAGVYAMMPVEHDMIGIYMAVGSANHMAPWGGLDLLLSTNPIAIGVPGGSGGPVLLDMATTNAAYGKVKLAAQRGDAIPEGWMIDADGHPLTDPKQAAHGSLVPIGGPKGYGLALMIGLLAGTLNGAAMGKEVVDFNTDDKTSTNTGQTVIVIDLKAMGDPDQFKKDVDRIRDELTGSKLRPGFDEIRLPGDRALATRTRRLHEGVPCPTALLDSLRAVANEVGVASLDDRI
ncbi:Ldh family oxidoreductase [Pseudorhodoplanes sinuspersici]|uniref:Lactate dehydrogenase n=1 Tax=Pseudorhodoplanes sinuspersici TaxID=1235591 RepID=A0A1W6ZKY1_9HYPH|nr:Ldh family oxidoreductase [Pseudorhodoplanes sinuspersici]ARP97780.1 lactate dehydrogenase [Pseudorhodoplanes sinuspersici]RKE68493.1 LDH2 family malate/lactate/ureidoglycolate dehydrogenase [Pseudorhodoplanes sinuspersici]